MVPGDGAFDRAGGCDDDIVSLAPSTSTLAGDDDARVNARRHHDSPPRDLSRRQIPPSTSRSHRSGLSDGGSTRPFRASVSAPARTWRTRALSLIVESDGATSEWVLRVDPFQLSSPDERGDAVGSTLVFGGFDATRLRVRAGPSRAPRDESNAGRDAGDAPGGEDPGVRWVSLTRMGGGSEEIPTFFYRVDDDADDDDDDDDAVTMSFAVATGAMGSFGSPVGATTISSASVAASTADPSREDDGEVEDECESLDAYRISPWMPGSAASSLRDPTPRVHRPTDRDVMNVRSTNGTRGPTPGAMDDTPRRLTFADGDDDGGTESHPPSEGTALLAAVMAEVSTPSRFTGVTNLTHRLGLGPVATASAETPSSVRQATNGEVFPEDVESSFEKSFDGGYGGEDVEAAIDAGEQVLTPTLARAMRRVGTASTSPSTCSSTSASTSASARVPLLDAWRTERTTSAAFRVWRMSAVLTNQERERATLIRLRNEAIAAGITPSPIATPRGWRGSEAPSSPAPSSAASSRRDTLSFSREAAAFTPGTRSSAREGPAEDVAEDTEDAAEAARSAAELRRLGESVSSMRAAARLEESDDDRETRAGDAARRLVARENASEDSRRDAPRVVGGHVQGGHRAPPRRGGPDRG